MCHSRRSTRVVEDHPEHVPAPAVDGTDAVAHLHAVVAAGAAAWAVVYGEHDGLALRGAQHDRSRLLSRPLLDEHALATGEVHIGPREHHEELQRERQSP